MKRFCRILSLAVVGGFLAGCSGESGESLTPADNPQAGLDAIKKLQAPIDPKAVGKDAATPAKK